MPRRTRKRKAYPQRYRPMRMAPGSQYAMRGIVDMSTMAVGGMVGAGMIGMVGGLLPHP